MSRLPEFDDRNLTDAQRRVHDAITQGPRGTVRGPLRVWLESPELADRAQSLGAFCRYGTSLPPRLSELAIITVGAYWKAGFEWHAHAPLALEAGVSATAVDAIRVGATPRFERDDEEVVHAFTDELLRAHAVSDAIWTRAQATLGSRGVVELVGICGYYGLISMTIKAYRIPVPPDALEPFAD